MATDLNLKTKWTGKDKVRISWTDTYSLAQDTKGQWIIGIGAIGLFFVMIASVSTGGTAFFMSLAAFVGFCIFGAMGKLTHDNAVTIDNQYFEHKGRTIAVEDITRIDYSRRSEWTGNRPHQGAPDPTQIRVWIGDVSFHTISENMWQTQVNHKIRHTLDEALQSIRKASVQEAQAEEHGKPDESNDFGMPEY